MAVAKASGESKLVSLTDFRALREAFRQQGRKVVHCHGVFDLLHPGHIAHLQEAKSYGDILVVSVTAAPYVNKGPGRPYFSDELRMQSLAALACVDYVLLSESPSALDIIEVVQPDIYVKGQEYANSEEDVTGNINQEVAKVQALGGEVRFTNGVVFSSTKLINAHFPVFPPGVKEFMREFAARYTFNHVRRLVDAMQSLRVLVVGDVIIDEYVFCHVQGLMSKDRGLSARYEREERYLGGGLAVARHIAGFSNNVTLCAIVGNEPHVHTQLLNEMSRSMILDLQLDESYRTVVKRRFLERRGIRDEYAKLFSLNYLDLDFLENKIDRRPFYDKLARLVPNHDLVVVADYGHGLIDGQVMEILQAEAKCLAVNCQTNSSNYGTNLITKYRRADIFTLDEVELRLAFASRSAELAPLLVRLAQHLSSRAGWLTLGSLGSLSVDRDLATARTPAFTLTVQDTVGAGDAFFALAALATMVADDVTFGSFLANIAGALAANVVGNSRSVEKADLLKFASTLLKF
ncbi:PfkB family carbohydrate kinase [Thermodesulfitimonas autotrophica]|uniref:PfkB family carbohydrate kinase n=1 Tax=Thermodesulfitimonas autotrophica TaxID=1894989 RepID=UPI002FDF2095